MQAKQPTRATQLRSKPAAEKRTRQRTSERELFEPTTYRIAMAEVFEKTNDLERTKPWKVLVATNLANSVMKHVGKLRKTAMERTNTHKFLCFAVASSLSRRMNDSQSLLADSSPLRDFILRKDLKFAESTFVVNNIFEHFSDLLFVQKELNNKEATDCLIGMALFRRSLRELDVRHSGHGERLPGHIRALRERLLQVLKMVVKAAGLKALYELKDIPSVVETLRDTSFDSGFQEIRVQLNKLLESELPRMESLKSPISGPAHPPQPPSAAAASQLAAPPAGKPEDQIVCQNRGMFNFEVNREQPRQQRRFKREVCRELNKSESFCNLMNPFFKVTPEPSFYQDFIDRTFVKNEAIPKTFDQVRTYFPNYQLISDLLHKPVPQQEDRDKSPFVINSLFAAAELSRAPSLESTIDRIVEAVQSHDRSLLPYLLDSDQQLKSIVLEIIDKKMVLLNVVRDEVMVQSIGSVDDPFFGPLPQSFKQNLRLLFYIHQAHKTFTSSAELALCALASHFYTASLGLTLKTLIRLTAFVKFVAGDRVYLVCENRVPSEVVFRETMRVYSAAGDESEARTREQFNEFVAAVKAAAKVDFNAYFTKRTEVRPASFVDNVLSLLQKSDARPQEPAPRPGFFSDSANSLAPGSLKPLFDRQNKYDYKKMYAFKRQLKNDFRQEAARLVK